MNDAPREWLDTDYYARLGVSSKATQKEIQKAYRQLARELHPDQNPDDPASEERFKQVSGAYDVLGDEAKRARYDEVRRLVSQDRVSSGRSGPSSNASGFGFSRGRSDGYGTYRDGGFASVDPDGFSDLSDLLGGMFPSTRPRRSPDVRGTVTVSFQDACLGTRRTLSLSMTEPCPSCGGNGCGLCGNVGSTLTTRSIDVNIPAGVRDGQTVRMRGQARSTTGLENGDLLLDVHVEPDARFRRVDDHIAVSVPISFTRAALGGTVEAPTFTRPVTFKIPPGTPSGKSFRIPKPKSHMGLDLLVTVEVQVPGQVNDELRRLLEQLDPLLEDAA